MWAAFAKARPARPAVGRGRDGFGGGAVEAMLVAEALGDVLTLESWLATVVLGGWFLCDGATTGRPAESVSSVAESPLLLTFAQTEPQSR